MPGKEGDHPAEVRRIQILKILLAACNAKYIHSNLAVYNLKSCSGEYSPNVVIKEYTINQIQDDILKDIYLEQPDVICFSCYIWNISFVKELVPDLKKILPHVDFWAGGPEVSYDAVEFLKKNPAFFGVMVGEGEETFHELAGYYIERKPEILHLGQVFLLGAVIFLTFIFLRPPAKQFRMDVLDVGQGDGIFLNSGNGTTFFVDGGSVSESAVGTYEILPFLKYHRVRAIDYWIVSHGDEDHISGLEEILSSGYKVRNLLISSGMPHDNAWWKLMQLAKEQGTEVIEADSGAYLLSGDMRISFYADADQNRDSKDGNGALKVTEAAKDRNECSLAMLAEYKTVRMLLAGDMGSAQEEWLAEQPGIRGQFLDVLKASHHGSKNSSSEKFLQATHPEYTVISCGKKNRYGHPHEEALQRMKEAGTEIHKTMEEGQVTVTFKEGKIQINKRK